MTGGFDARVNGTENGSGESDQSGPGPEIGHIDYVERCRGYGNDSLGCHEGKADSEQPTNDGEEDGLTHKKVNDHPRLSTESLQNADFAGALDHSGIHGEENDEKADSDPHNSDHLNKDFERADGIDAEHGKKIGQRHGLQIAGEGLVQDRNFGVGARRIVQLDIDLIQATGIFRQILQCIQAHYEARQHTGLHDTG